MMERQKRALFLAAVASVVLACSEKSDKDTATAGMTDSTDRMSGGVATAEAELRGMTGLDARHESSSDAATLQPTDNYGLIGKHDPAAGNKCDVNCNGALKELPYGPALEDANLARFVLNTPLRTVPAAATRRPAAPGQNGAAFLSVGSVANNRQIALEDLVGKRAQVVAVLVVGQNSALDARYGLSSAVARGMSDKFFIVAHDFDTSDPSEPTSGPARFSRKVAKWSLYGIRDPGSRSPKIEKMKASGTLRWCRHKHAVTNNTGWAGFTNCEAQRFAEAILNDSAAMDSLKAAVRRNPSATMGLPEGELGWVHLAVGAWASANAATVKSMPSGGSAATQRLVAFARLLDDSLAWFTCGVGCCIADS